MAEQSFTVTFYGYWGEKAISGIPQESGIYCVYTAVKNTAENTVSLKKLIYIGESENVNDRIKNHEKWDDWKKKLSNGETIYFSFAPVGSSFRCRVEAAFIFKHKPPVNTEYVNSFPFDKTTITTQGETALLSSLFTVNRT